MSKRFLALAYTLVICLLVTSLAIPSEVRKLGINDISVGPSGSTWTSPAGKVVRYFPYPYAGYGTTATDNASVFDVRAYGEDLTNTTIQNAIDNAANGDTVIVPHATYTFAGTVTVNKSIALILNGTQITGPASGYAFDVTVNDVSIIGHGDAKITLTAGCEGGIRNNQAMRTRYRDFKIDMNDVANAIGFYHLGGWYVDVENVEIEKAQTAASSDGIKIVGTYTGVAGSTGSWGGAYVSTYKNVVARTVRMDADWVGSNLNKVTTMTFINLDAETVYATNSLSLTFVQPVMQITSGGTFWSLDNVAGITITGGDFEGSGATVYTLTETVRGINSIGNQISGANTYMSGDVSASGFFMDDYTPADLTGHFRGYIGSAQHLLFKNSGYTFSARMGNFYAGDVFSITNNITPISDTSGTLDNTDNGASIITSDTSGRVRIQQASPGTNPVAVDNVAQFDSGGAILVMPYTYDNNAAAISGGLTAGRLYRTSTGQLMIVYTP